MPDNTIRDLNQLIREVYGPALRDLIYDMESAAGINSMTYGSSKLFGITYESVIPLDIETVEQELP